MKETNVTRLIMIGLSKAGNIRVFRNNTAQAWQGTSKKFITEGARRVLKLYDPRPIDAGLCEGSSDLIGWTTVTVTPEMVGQKIAVFTAIEVKKDAESTASEMQINFLTVIKNMGGFAGLATNTDDALRLLRVR